MKQESCVRLIREKTPLFDALRKAVIPLLPERTVAEASFLSEEDLV